MVMQLSVARDVEDQCIRQISTMFASLPEVSAVPVGTRIPVDGSGVTLTEFVRLIASASQSETLKTTSWTITVEGWAQSETRAARITALAVSALMESHGLLFGPSLLGGAGNDPEPDYPAMSRYSATVEVRSRNLIQNI